jgi:hypothetical protein
LSTQGPYLAPGLEDLFKDRYVIKALGTWKKLLSTLIVAARMPVYLSVNTSVTRNAARLIYGLPGSALVVRGSHPLDD